ncbi:MAG: electron transport complex subunit RsxE [Lachnospiraceae bacterium]
MNKYVERVYNGIIKENPTFVLMLGMCPTLAVTTSAMNGLGMGLTTTAVLIMSNLLISALRNIIPDRVRIPAYIVIVASLVTIVQLLLEAYIPDLYKTLGIYIPLIVVNCIILGRAESYAGKNKPILSAFDGIGMGLGFTVGLTSIGIFRELLGNGTVFAANIMPASYEPISIFVLAPGAFFVLAMLTALQNKLKLKSATNTNVQNEYACGGNCLNCSGGECVSNHEKIETEKAKKEEMKKAVLSKGKEGEDK